MILDFSLPRILALAGILENVPLYESRSLFGSQGISIVLDFYPHKISSHVLLSDNLLAWEPWGLDSWHSI